jgi:hypothetical protein
MTSNKYFSCINLDQQTRDCISLDKFGSQFVDIEFGTDVLSNLREQILRGEKTDYSYYQIKNSIALWESRDTGSVIRLIEDILLTKLQVFSDTIESSGQLTFEMFCQLWDHYQKFYQNIETILSVFFPLTAKTSSTQSFSLIEMIGYAVFYEKIFAEKLLPVPFFDPNLGFEGLSSDAERQMARFLRTIGKIEESIWKSKYFELIDPSPELEHARTLYKSYLKLLEYRPAVEAVVKEIDRILVRTKDCVKISNDDHSEIMDWCAVLRYVYNEQTDKMIHTCYLKYLQSRILNHPRKNYKIEILTVMKLSLKRGKYMIEQICDVERSMKIRESLQSLYVSVKPGQNITEIDSKKCTPYYLRSKLWKITKQPEQLKFNPPPVIEHYQTLASQAYYISTVQSEENTTKLVWDYYHGHVTFELALGTRVINVRAHMIQAMIIGHFEDVYEIAIETLEEMTNIPQESILKIIVGLVESGLFYVNQETHVLTINMNNEGLENNIDLTPYYLEHFAI